MAAVLATALLVPLVVTALLAWTLVGRLCSMRPLSVFVLVAPLVVTPCLVDANLGHGDYAFSTSLFGESSGVEGGRERDDRERDR